MRRLLILEGSAVVGIAMAIGLGLLDRPGPEAEIEAEVLLLSMGGILAISAVGAICRTGTDRPRWAGFAASGWGYFGLACWYTWHQGPLPTVAWIPGSEGYPCDLLALPPRIRIAHDAWALIFAIAGGRLASRFSADLPIDVPVRWQVRGLVGSSGFLAALVVALAGWQVNRQIAAGALFLMAWTLTGFCILGAILSRGHRRVTWIGAASFGLGYLVMAFGFIGSPELPTNHLLNAVFRPAGPVHGDETFDESLTTDEASRRVREALHHPITLRFPGGTNLAVVLPRIQERVGQILGKKIHVFVWMHRWPARLEDLEKVRVSIDREDIPMREALGLCLGQVGMTYRVQSGYVGIFPDAYEPVAYEEDPAMIAGHSLLAMLAAAIGGLAAPRVASFFRPVEGGPS